jgi:NAD(P)-dependent dehydrogenase (short-subunit alcohol dehydrogenase family)
MAKLPKQHQERQPGLETEMTPKPKAEDSRFRAKPRLEGKVAVITGGDSGIGRAVALAFAQEGSDLIITYLNEHEDAKETKKSVEKVGKKCILIAGNIQEENFCKKVIATTIDAYGKIDILVNNAAEQHPQENFENISAAQLENTFRTNIFSYFFCSQAALKYLKPGGTIINTTSVTAYRGSDHLIDYSATKGAIVAFTRSLSKNLSQKNIRVNAVAPGPVWTPLIPSTFSEEKVEHFGEQVPMGRVGQPEEIAPSYVFLASDDASYMSGQVLHVNGGEIVNG